MYSKNTGRRGCCLELKISGTRGHLWDNGMVIALVLSNLAAEFLNSAAKLLVQIAKFCQQKALFFE